MSCLVAISGKGGVGKTTVSSLIVRQMVKNGMEPVLAIDADPNSCSCVTLGSSASWLSCGLAAIAANSSAQATVLDRSAPCSVLALNSASA